jgi:hypothetical protein
LKWTPLLTTIPRTYSLNENDPEEQSLINLPSSSLVKMH